MHPPPSGVLLVHGAWHTGNSTWASVATQLRESGVPAAVAELHRGSLAADTAAAVDALAELTSNGPAVACGHSYGGSVITGLPTDQVSHLVYLCATMPDEGETTLGLMAGAPRTPLFDAITWVDHEDGTAVLDPALAGEILHNRGSADERSAHATTLVPQCMRPGREEPEHIAWHHVPSTYVVCADDRALHPDLQRRMAQRATHTLTWDSDHSPFLAHGTELAEMLSALARPGVGL